MKKRKLSVWMRLTHRYLGFFTTGIMAIYAISGVLLVYRDTDLLKKETVYNKVIEKNLSEKDLNKQLKIKNLEIQKIEGSIMYFKNGTYNKATGEAHYSKMELPKILDKMTKLHKSPSKDTLGGLNVLFGVSLFFFVISSFWMFNSKSKVFKLGMLVALGGIIISIILLYLT